MADNLSTTPDGAPGTPPASAGQTDYKAEYEKALARYGGLDGAFKQHRDKSTAELEAAKQAAKQYEEQLSASKAAADAYQAKSKELEPFKTQVDDLNNQLNSAKAQQAKLRSFLKFPSLVGAADESGNNPYLSLVESSNLEGEALENMLKPIAEKLTSPASPNRTGATPSTPPKGAEPTAATLAAEAEVLMQKGDTTGFHQKMNESYQQLDKERGKPFLPPLPKGASFDLPPT